MMTPYDPLNEPDPQEWRALDESEQINPVTHYHREAGIDLPNELLQVRGLESG